MANAPAKADVRAEEARRKEARTRVACAAGATATAERVAMVVADTRCELECVPSARERALRGRDRGRQARTSEKSDVSEHCVRSTAFDRRHPGSFTGKGAISPVTSRPAVGRKSQTPKSANDRCLFEIVAVCGKRRLATRSTCAFFLVRATDAKRKALCSGVYMGLGFRSIATATRAFSLVARARAPPSPFAHTHISRLF